MTSLEPWLVQAHECAQTQTGVGSWHDIKAGATRGIVLLGCGKRWWSPPCLAGWLAAKDDGTRRAVNVIGGRPNLSSDWLRGRLACRSMAGQFPRPQRVAPPCGFWP